MRCQNCGAEISGGKFCEFCGSQITSAMRREQEQIDKIGCPKCGSSNIFFNREKQGEIKTNGSTVILRSTVGVCNDCGYTWLTDKSAPVRIPTPTPVMQPVQSTPQRVVEPVRKKKRKTWLWVLGWIFIFPVPLTILLLRKKNMNPVLKYGIIAAVWIIFFMIGQSSNANAMARNDNYRTTFVIETNVVTSKADNPNCFDSSDCLFIVSPFAFSK